MISAPLAPIAPPSVGVATPRKIVPSTRKISASGGISTKVTRSASRDSKPNLSRWLMTAEKNATPVPTQVEMTIVSSVGVSAARYHLANANAAITETIVSISSERVPPDPSGSRRVRASSGSAGAHFGLMVQTPKA